METTTPVFGVIVEDLPASYQALEVVVLVKAIDGDGKVCFLNRYSEGLCTPEAIGMLRVAEATELHGMVDAFVTTEDDDE